MTKQEIKKAIGTTNITSRAMLVHLSISRWKGFSKDKQVRDEVTSQKHAGSDAGTWTTCNIPKSARSGIQSVFSQGKKIHDEWTLPWSNNGSRILPAEMFLKYTEEMRKLQKKYYAAVEAFLKDYPQIIENAKKRLGDLYNPERFPSVEQARRKFSWSIDVYPIPSANDFRVDLDKENGEAIKKAIDEKVNATITKAVGDIWERLFDVISKVADKLKDPKATFRDSLINNVTELCDLLPVLNITGDKALKEMEKDIRKKITEQKPTELRDNPVDRKKTAKNAKEILCKMETFMGQKK